MRDGVVGGVAVLFGRVGAGAEFSPVVLLDGSGEGDVDAGEVVEETPAAGGFVDREGFRFAAEDAVLPGDVFGQEEFVVLPLGLFIDPETPVVVGDEGSVFGVGNRGLRGVLRRGGFDVRGNAGDGGSLQKSTAGESAHNGSASLAQIENGLSFRDSSPRASPVWGSVHAGSRAHDSGMDKTQEFWLRLAVIGSALVLVSSALAAFFG